ncbi:MAG: hypothetical protein GY953_29820, partial [bacterium]|nr:hypothetical protein [bacterium]
MGFMGCGKTTIGQVLARKLGWHFVDSDDKIEEIAGHKITEIFERSGERQFRKLEAEAVAECVRRIESGYPTGVALCCGAFAPQPTRRLALARRLLLACALLLVCAPAWGYIVFLKDGSQIQ